MVIYRHVDPVRIWLDSVFFLFRLLFFYIIVALTRFFPVRGYISFRVTITLDATEVLYIL